MLVQWRITRFALTSYRGKDPAAMISIVDDDESVRGPARLGPQRNKRVRLPGPRVANDPPQAVGCCITVHLPTGTARRMQTDRRETESACPSRADIGA